MPSLTHFLDIDNYDECTYVAFFRLSPRTSVHRCCHANLSQNPAIHMNPSQMLVEENSLLLTIVEGYVLELLL